MTHEIHFVDVFAEQPYAGNPLAVVLGADDLSVEMMQKVAVETNYSETTFVMAAPEADGGYRVRMFTPAREIAFAGHPILGTTWVIREQFATKPEIVRLNLPVGQVPVTFETLLDKGEVAWFLAPPVTVGPTYPPELIASACGLSVEDIATGSPIQQLSGGVAITIVPLRSLEALQRIQLGSEWLAKLTSQGLSTLTYFFCPETRHPENNLSARFFFDAHGVREDPATGNGAAFLGAYLLEHRVFQKSDLSLRIEQGYEVGRPSLVLLRARLDGGSRVVSVGGAVVATIRGELL